MIITIDGMIATGKSSVAKRLAEEIGYIYFDTGAMYRCVAYALMQAGIAPIDTPAVEAFLNTLTLDIKIKYSDRRYIVNGVDATEAIRSPSVSAAVSQIAALPMVRDKMVALQRNHAKGVNAIFEGRDMGTVVFPNADLKIFLVSNPEVRAARRYAEMLAKFPNQMVGITLEQMLADINARDTYDSERALSPLKKADDAYIVDTSDLDIDGVVVKILEIRDMRKTNRQTKPFTEN
jgi:cytidylate kinase